MTIVNIPEGTDMNNMPPQPPENTTPDFPAFPDDIFDCLPPVLQKACELFKVQEEKELFLVGALGVLSGIMPNVQGLYFGRNVYPNLYCFIMGKYGTGKGAMLWARDLGEQVEQYRESQAKESIKNFEAEKASYHKQQKLYDKGKTQTVPIPPKAPRHLKLFIPANSTKTAVMQLLMENDGRGIMFETEGDTLADMLRQDYGNFSDVLRKAFHHEPVSYYRRADNEDVNIEHPSLSVVLSGTPDQLKKLIPTIDNGLFSRFCFYVLQSTAPFNNPFDSKVSELGYYFNRLAERFLVMYKILEARTEPLQFTLQAHQQALFVNMFDKIKTEMRGVGDDLDGTVNRLGLICYRIAMVLSIARNYELDGVDIISCNDTDFNNAMLIAEHLMSYSMHVYETLTVKQPLVMNVDEKQERIAECCRQYNLGYALRKISLSVLGAEKKAPTVLNWVKKFCSNKRA
jgi:hypothetical protein